MHAVVIEAGELHWQERDDPVPDDHEVLVAVRAAGLNGADLIQRAGRYAAPPGAPADIPGLELAGEVVAIGRRVTRCSVGDRIMAVVGGGGQATMAVVDEAHVLEVPVDLDWPGAGGFPEVFTTAFDALFVQAGLTVGERVLVTGAAGGVGTAGVQLAAMAGARVVASVRDPGAREAVAALGSAPADAGADGAVVAIDPAEVSDHGPYDVVLELVGAASLPTALSALATKGRAVVIGVGSGAKIELNLLELMGKRARLGGATLRARSSEEKAQLAGAVAIQVLPALADGRLRVPIAATFPMSEAAAAYERFSAGKKLGKVVLLND